MSGMKVDPDSEAYDAWFRQKVQEALDDPSPCIPHETVMAEARAIIERIAAAKAEMRRPNGRRFPD